MIEKDSYIQTPQERNRRKGIIKLRLIPQRTYVKGLLLVREIITTGLHSMKGKEQTLHYYMK
jgi:hypothetical protein